MKRQTLTITVEYFDHDAEDGECEKVLELPAKYEVCPKCDGKGTHVNEAIDGHGISREEFYEDPDFEEAYFRGDYDVQCYECKGERVVKVVDEDECKRKGLLADFTKYVERETERAQWDAEDRYTRRMESGSYDY